MTPSFQCWMDVCECWRNGKPDHEALALLMFLALTGLRLGKPVTFALKMWTGAAKLSPSPHQKRQTRRVPVCDKAFVLLTEQRQHLGDEGWVFPGKGTDNPVSEPRRLQNDFVRLRVFHRSPSMRCVIPLRQSPLRAGPTFIPSKTLLGHSTIKVTELYLHRFPARYHEVVNRAMG